jgi:SagB-type dehydrogenase family enzyme
MCSFDPQEPAGRAFMQNTRLACLEPSDQMKGLPRPPLELSPAPGARIISLPDPADISTPPVDLRTAIESRRSVRRYADTPLSLDELAFILWCTQGVRDRVDGEYTIRNVPSAGARHAIETYLCVNRVEGLAPGLYRYLPLEHALVEVKPGPGSADKITAACLHQRFIRESAVTFIWTAVAYRMIWRYGERGYRYLHLDAGHVSQNLYLSARIVGCGVCAVGAFDDDILNQELGIDGENHFTIFMASLGKIE